MAKNEVGKLPLPSRAKVSKHYADGCGRLGVWEYGRTIAHTPILPPQPSEHQSINRGSETSFVSFGSYSML